MYETYTMRIAQYSMHIISVHLWLIIEMLLQAGADRESIDQAMYGAAEQDAEAADAEADPFGLLRAAASAPKAVRVVDVRRFVRRSLLAEVRPGLLINTGRNSNGYTIIQYSTDNGITWTGGPNHYLRSPLGGVEASILGTSDVLGAWAPQHPSRNC